VALGTPGLPRRVGASCAGRHSLVTARHRGGDRIARLR